MKKVFLLMVTSALLVSLGFAQTPPAGSNTDQVNVKGCLGGSDGNYTVAEAVSYTHLDVYKRQPCMRHVPRQRKRLYRRIDFERLRPIRPVQEVRIVTNTPVGVLRTIVIVPSRLYVAVVHRLLSQTSTGKRLRPQAMNLMAWITGDSGCDPHSEAGRGRALSAPVDYGSGAPRPAAVDAAPRLK